MTKKTRLKVAILRIYANLCTLKRHLYGTEVIFCAVIIIFIF